jgi:nicotinamide mononucleotide transporter
MQEWLAPLQAPTALGMSWAEALGAATGLGCVWLVARQSTWNWPVGLANNAFWCSLFWSSRLYADAVLQVVFAALGVYGWWSWVAGARGAPALPVRRTTVREWVTLGPVTLLATLGLAAWLSARTDSPAPLADASVLTLSLAATYGQARKLLESWWWWIAVDVVSIPLYVSRGLYPTAGVYAVFLVLCVKGLADWSRALAHREVAPA